MAVDQNRIAALEQALYAVLSAAEQCGVNADDLRLVAMSGLSISASWQWIDEARILDAELEIKKAVSTIRAKNC